MSSQNYKKLAIKHFYNKDFNTARTYFCLAYERRPNKRLLNFIDLCNLAFKAPKEAFLLFEFYLAHYTIPNIDKDLAEILENVDLRQEQRERQNEVEESNALSYGDFLQSERVLGFKKSFENVIFNTKLIIDNKDDFLDFLEKLFDNGYKDIVFTYLENVSPHLWSNERFMRLHKKLIGLKKWL